MPTTGWGLSLHTAIPLLLAVVGLAKMQKKDAGVGDGNRKTNCDLQNIVADVDPDKTPSALQ